MPESHLPSGTVAFLFTDIEGSTRRWQTHGEVMGKAVARHDAMLRREIESRDGYVFKTVGDAFCAAFPTVSLALAAALASQRALAAEAWGELGVLRARMAVHVGAAEEREADYFGPAVNRVARLLSSGHGGQVLLSHAAEELVRDNLAHDVLLRDLGEHRLKDLARPERIFQLISPDLPAEFPPLATLDHRPNNLPPQLTPFIGRDAEVAAICERIGRSDVRLVTLTGPGGTGKTRLSLQVAANLVDTVADGTWLVELEATTNQALVVTAIGQVLGVREDAGRSSFDALVEHLRTKQLLLVLDNFEQVADAAPLVAKLLLAAPGIKALVTSRIRLGIRGEYEVNVLPLGLPPRGRALPDLAELSRYEAVRLFVDRAEAAKAGFTLTPGNAAAVAQICADLDGLPLAIELAAARVKLLPPTALLARLGDRLKLLVGGGRDRPERQQTLRGAISWSHALLPEEERLLFARLAVFAGGCTLEAVEAVANPDGRLDVLADLGNLVDHSLVRQEVTEDDEPRFAMLATIREFAREKLKEASGGEAELTQMLHAEHYLALAESAEPGLTGAERAVWMARLEAEHDNLRSALAWCEQTGEAETGLQLAASLWRFWWTRGHLSEGRAWLERAMESGTGATAKTRARALDGAGWLAMAQGEYDLAARLLEQALGLHKQRENRRGMASSLEKLGVVAMNRGDHEHSRRLFEESLTICRKLGEPHAVSSLLNSLGALSVIEARYPEAAGYFEESLDVSRRLGSSEMVALALGNLGETRQRQGDLERATALYREALRLHREVGNKGWIADVLANLGSATLSSGDTAQASEMLQEGLALFHEVGDRAGLSACLEGLAAVATLEGHPARAARLFGAAQAQRETIGIPVHPAYQADHDHRLAAIRDVLNQEDFTLAWAAGRALSLEAAVAEAIA